MPKYDSEKKQSLLEHLSKHCGVHDAETHSILFIYYPFLNVLTFSTYPRRISEPIAICNVKIDNCFGELNKQAGEKNK